MDSEELEAWLRLAETPGVGRSAARQLLARFGEPEAIFRAPSQRLREHGGAAAAALLAAPDARLRTLIDATRRWLAEAVPGERHVVTFADPAFPASLLHTADPPLLLYVQGRLDLLNAPSIAIVGSRNPTAQGLDNARAFASHLSAAGWTVVSGLALGIDAAAHEGALEGAGSTVAVVGTGLDRVYPKRHLALAHRIAQSGAMVSEFALGTPAIAHHFPQRNRIIAGMTRGTLVVEAALQSGSLITARLAAEASREVFAIPGSIHSPQSRGCHALIKQGAKLVDAAQDILEELAPGSPGSAPGRPVEAPADAVGATSSPAAAWAQPLLDAMGYEPVSLDELVSRTGWPAHELNAKLLELELAGAVARLPGQTFQRRGSA
jgi:DNA processing protein